MPPTPVPQRPIALGSGILDPLSHPGEKNPMISRWVPVGQEAVRLDGRRDPRYQPEPLSRWAVIDRLPPTGASDPAPGGGRSGPGPAWGRCRAWSHGSCDSGCSRGSAWPNSARYRPRVRLGRPCRAVVGDRSIAGRGCDRRSPGCSCPGGREVVQHRDAERGDRSTGAAVGLRADGRRSTRRR